MQYKYTKLLYERIFLCWTLFKEKISATQHAYKRHTRIFYSLRDSQKFMVMKWYDLLSPLSQKTHKAVIESKSAIE